jgi:hypothetical protein
MAIPKAKQNTGNNKYKFQQIHIKDLLIHVNYNPSSKHNTTVNSLPLFQMYPPKMTENEASTHIVRAVKAMYTHKRLNYTTR